MGGAESLLPAASSLGIGGFAIYIMWKMFEANGKERDRHTNSAQLEREKYMGIITDAHSSFSQYQKSVQDDVMKQMTRNTEALTRVLDHFAKHT